MWWYILDPPKVDEHYTHFECSLRNFLSLTFILWFSTNNFITFLFQKLQTVEESHLKQMLELLSKYGESIKVERFLLEQVSFILTLFIYNIVVISRSWLKRHFGHKIEILSFSSPQEIQKNIFGQYFSIICCLWQFWKFWTGHFFNFRMKQ